MSSVANARIHHSSMWRAGELRWRFKNGRMNRRAETPMTIGTYNNKEERSNGRYRQEQSRTRPRKTTQRTLPGLGCLPPVGQCSESHQSDGQGLLTLSFPRLDTAARQDMGGAVIGPSTQWEPEKRRGASTARTPSNARERAPAKVPSPKFPRKATQYVV